MFLVLWQRQHSILKTARWSGIYACGSASHKTWVLWGGWHPERCWSNRLYPHTNHRLKEGRRACLCEQETVMWWYSKCQFLNVEFVEFLTRSSNRQRRLETVWRSRRRPLTGRTRRRGSSLRERSESWRHDGGAWANKVQWCQTYLVECYNNQY